MVGGMMLMAVGGAAYGAVKLSQKDAQRIEEYAGAPVEELEEEELVGAMQELGIQSAELTPEDKAALAQDQEAAAPAAPQPAAPAPPPAAPAGGGENYLDELERLADLRDRGIITREDFEAKKNQLLGL
jgi:hypothetical protein